MGSTKTTSIPRVAYVTEHVDRWEEPAWQQEAAARLGADDIDVVLSRGDNEIFRTSAEPVTGDEEAEGTRTVQRVVVDASDGPSVALVYADQQLGPPEEVPVEVIPFVGLAALGLTLFGIGMFVRRTVLEPLNATVAAAQGISRGELDVQLPSSRVREVAELNTAFERMSSDLRETLAQLAEMEDERRMFVGAIAHDLRTPLFSLRGYLEGLERGVADTEEKRARYLLVAQQKASELEHLIAQLFDFTRMELLDQSPQLEPLDLGGLLGGVAQGTLPLREANRIALTVDMPATPVTVMGEEALLRRVFENLLDNALRHTPEGGSITISCRWLGDAVRIVVADTGPGIPPDDLPRLFDPLFRGERSRNRRTGGAGLGLAIARRIVRAHGGEITAGNQPEGGAAFTITLPAAGEPDA
jgi:signal transduction histidine kinase